MISKMKSQVESERGENQRIRSEVTTLRGQCRIEKQNSARLEKSVEVLTRDLARVGGDEVIKENKMLLQKMETVEKQADEERIKYEQSKAQASDLEQKLRVLEGKVEYYKQFKDTLDKQRE